MTIGTPPRPAPSGTTQGGTVVVVDLLRFAAALLVVAYHFGTVFPEIDGAVARRFLPDGQLGFLPWTRFGWVGVEIFFVISGYVIAGSVEHGGPVDFLRRRLLRLYPAAWICGLLGLAAILAFGLMPLPVALTRLWHSLLLWPWQPWTDDVFWTLGIEMSFYLAVALLLAVGGRGGVRHGIRAVGLASLLAWALLDYGDPAAMHAMINGRSAHLMLLTHGCLFALGAELRRMARHGSDLPGLCLLLLFAGGLGAEVAVHEWDRARALGVAPAWHWPLALAAGGTALVASAHRLQWLVAGWGWAARTAGLTTYPLYLTHNMIGAALAGALLGAGLPVSLAIAGALAAVLLLSVWIARTAEPALRRPLARLLQPSARSSRPWPSAR